MRTTLSLLATLAATSCVHAAALTIELGGTEYEGPPEYEIVVDGTVVGSGMVENLEGQVVKVDLSNDAELLGIRFTNDAAAPVQPDGTRAGDRNLIIRSVALDGTIIPLNEFAGEHSAMQGANLVMYSNTELHLDLTAVATTEEAEASSLETLNGDAEPAKTEVSASEGEGGLVPGEQTGPRCDAMAEVSNYANNAIELVPEQYSVLSEILDTRGCALIVTGYSSTSGPAATNARVSEARAQAVLDYLLTEGASFTATQVISGGETTQFGPSQGDNRRVVVELK